MPGISKPKVVIYSTPSCPICKRAKEYFSQKGIAFEEIDVSADRKAAAEMIKKSRQMGVPVIFVGDSMLIGYNPLKLEAVLKK